MVDTLDSVNGAAEAPSLRAELPAELHISSAEMQRVPSPGTLRALKAMTGREYNELIGGTDSADQFQTFIWAKLRREFPGLRWDECDEVELIIEGAVPDPLAPSASGFASSPRSAGSGG
jgi:hypothetical protein